MSDKSKVVRIQQGNQVVTMTLPAEIAKALDVKKGDYVKVEWNEELKAAVIRKISSAPAPVPAPVCDSELPPTVPAPVCDSELPPTV